MLERDRREICELVTFSCSNYKILRFLLLEHQVHCFHVFGSPSPVALHLDISEYQVFFVSGGDTAGGRSDLFCYEMRRTQR